MLTAAVTGLAAVVRAGRERSTRRPADALVDTTLGAGVHRLLPNVAARLATGT
jgi:hypothetical protein